MADFLQQKIPIAQAIDAIVDWLTENLSGLFSLLQVIGQSVMDVMSNTLAAIPPILLILLLIIAAYFVFNKKWQMPVFILIGFVFIYNQNMWDDLMYTLTLVIVSSFIAIVIGVPVGIVMAKSDKAQVVIKPILDVMQTMPSFVYLIPAVAFFGIGMVPGTFASVIFAVPPTVRLTNLGIRQVDTEIKEASDSLGGTGFQKLIKVELPLAKGNIFAGINQTTMMVLSMVVIASMIGTPGLGQGVLAAVQRSQIGSGFVYGVGVVILAIMMDRFTQSLNKNRGKDQSEIEPIPKKRKILVGGLTAAAVIVLAIIGGVSQSDANKGALTLAYAEQDDQVATTTVIAQVLEEQGYNVTMTALDIPVTFEAVANGQADAMLGAWLPTTHEANYAQLGDQLDNLGPSLDEQAQNGIVVPSYMDVDSIEDLTDEADQTITGVEPGAGNTAAAQATLEAYPNLEDWELATSSAGAMTTQLERAISQEEEVVVSAWSPHWIFSRFDVKFLEDPEGGMGGAESIVTMARLGLEEDMPEAYQILDNFQWEVEDIESVMLEIEEGTDPEVAAQNWIEENPDKVEEWVK
ncbi:ABC transporter permease/substrate binding protein [Tetragenococcus koreensis]|uniref:Glycine betaine/carnitine/choline ABC transporter substrate-binding protein n=1 Tax=Tetragenococcus koreensis TaxID=290335 RepID=A0AAN4ZND8_9ENTE|nr:ABC transporter permease/substrate binding protein [Tetragenococcus koreensis]MCF1618057.1 ABC transporter permease/substrate binding protein [Tetragenococcus koreensis]MCF1622919.1 ABC transporter permease/substrate binding protein [Tetragenococcus koreensis]MCF1628000.1 ABC transporter permease/substrate binding protein [Tetragenococcus koreensis]MCF1632823.1 ABC transporter permease/substrate binding protein [Tetragenococcus koreensis]MCF1678878.1 ABC transporter permease/substrate bindi